MNAPDQVSTRVAALYARVSTDQQALRKDGSLDTQEDLLRRHVEQKRTMGERWEIKLYREEGVSGKTLDRPKFQEMMADIKAGKVQALAVVALDRVARNVRAFLGFLDFLIEHKVDFISLREQVDTGTPVGRLILTFLSALAEFERQVISARAKEKSDWRARNGLWHGGPQPLGYKAGNGTITPQEDEKHVVEAIYRTYLETDSVRLTAVQVNKMGYRTKRYQSRRGKTQGGKEFHKSHIAQILTNPAYIGKMKRNGQLVPAQYPGIIDEDLFYEVQHRLKRNQVVKIRRRRDKKYVFLLEGLLRCGYCGGALSPSYSKGRNGYIRYYCCINHRDNHTCKFGRINAEQIENLIGEQLVKLSTSPDTLAAVMADNNSGQDANVQAAQDRILALTATRRSLEGQIANLIDYLAQGKPSPSVAKRLAELERQEAELANEIDKAKADLNTATATRIDEPTVKASLEAFAPAYTAATPEERKQLFQLMLDEVVFTEEKVRMALYEVKLPPGPSNAAPNDSGSSGKVSWLALRDSNPETQIQSLMCYQLHQGPVGPKASTALCFVKHGKGNERVTARAHFGTIGRLVCRL